MKYKLTNTKRKETMEVDRVSFTRLMIQTGRPQTAINNILNNVNTNGFDTFRVSENGETMLIEKV